jgi:DNA-binding CsgD family transcriptional regulator
VDTQAALRAAPWAEQLAEAVWITGPDRKIAWSNEKARTLLGMLEAADQEHACYQIVCGLDAAGGSFCAERCQLMESVESGSKLESVMLQIRRKPYKKRWVHVLPIYLAASNGSGPWLVHCAIDAEREHRIEEHLEKMASRSFLGRSPRKSNLRWKLTPREREVLRLLTDGLDLHAIAAGLHLSYSTVRNHVQHILDKLGVHSMQEAVALNLLDTPSPGDLPAAGPPQGD